MKIIFILLAVISLSIIPIESAQSTQDIVFIINAENPVSQIHHNQIIDFFMKKSRNWPGSIPVRFFDHADTSEARKIFLQSYLKKSPREIEQYWIGQKLYTGNSAPTQVLTDSMMNILVSRFPGGIGYINSGTSLGKGVKRIEIIRDE